MGLPIAIVNIVLRTSTVTRAGFGTPIFISRHRNFDERVRTYQSLSALADDCFTDDAMYIAGTQFLANTPRVSAFKIGRRLADPVFTPINIATGTVYSMTLSAGGEEITLTYTASSGDDATDISAGLVADIPVDDPIEDYLTISDETGSVKVLPVSSSVDYTVDDKENLSIEYISTETAADCYNAIIDVDSDFYFITADDHTATFVTGMAATVQATEKVFFTSSQESSALATYTTAATDTPGVIKTNNYGRTTAMWHQSADTLFPECNYVAQNAPFAPDVESVTWDGRVLAGLPISLNTSGNPLTATQQLNLDARNCSYIVNTAAGARILGGKMGNGTWIDDQITLDCMTARVREGQEALILNQQGGKLPGGAEGVSLCEGALQASLNPFIAANSIESVKIYTENATIDNQTRTLTGMEFDAELTGAIHRIVINGNLKNQEV